jgi:hypothetical protein
LPVLRVLSKKIPNWEASVGLRIFNIGAWVLKHFKYGENGTSVDTNVYLSGKTAGDGETGGACNSDPA